MLKFSLIVPAFNAETSIEKCIKSVTEQTYSNWELFVIDDGSTDRTAEIAKRVLAHNNVVTKENAGVSSARNLGISLASGDYLLFLDADDYLPPNTLELYEQIIRTENTPDVIFGSFLKIYPKKEELCNPVGGNNIYRYDARKKEFDPFISRLAGTVWGKCYRADLIKNARFDEQLSMCEDAEFNYREFISAQKMVFVNQPVYCYVYSLNSTVRKFSHDSLKKYIEAGNKIIADTAGSFCYGNALEFICTVFNVVCYNLVFTKQNKDSYFKKRRVLQEVRKLDPFKTAIEIVDDGRLSIRHRLSIIFARHHMYFCIYLMSVMNQVSNKFLY